MDMVEEPEKAMEHRRLQRYAHGTAVGEQAI